MNREIMIDSICWISKSILQGAHRALRPLGLLAIAQVSLEAAVAPETLARPNVVVIYTDDQGYGDLAATNAEAKFATPNLDRLASQGVTLTRCHSADSVCTPSRYGLLTGRYAWRTKLKRGVLGAEAECLIEDGRMTVASLLKDRGYDTAMVGKWHLGMDFPGEKGSRDWSKPVVDMPLDKGFDYYFGIPASLNFGVLAWFEGRYTKTPPTLLTRKKKNPRSSDYRISPPFEVPLAGGSPQRAGLEVAPDFADNQCLTRFTDKAIDWMRNRLDEPGDRQPFFLYLSLTSPHYPICPRAEFHGRGDAGAYGEFMVETDHHIGRVLDFLADAGVEQNTIVYFSSDNGPERSWKQRLATHRHDSRGGLRGGKRSVYEGGHRVPGLIRWPVGISEPGRRCDAVVGQVDLLATLAEILGASLPDNAGEDSHSFARLLTDPRATHTRPPLVTHGNGGGQHRYAITDGRWKLILGKHPQEHELYDLLDDRSEKLNVAAANRRITGRLTESINQLISRGRTTPGSAQANDTGHWEDLVWLSKEEFTSRVRQNTP